MARSNAFACIVRFAALALLAAVPRGAAADLLLNEVLYDPDGPDEGKEFVELWNPGDAPASLAGVVLEAGDGATGSWAVVYRGAATDSVAPRSAFVIGGGSLLGALQNGPDAVRLSRAGATLDLLGYGPLVASALFRGEPAPDAPSGASLARVEDGVDTGVNARDWAAESTPTPGLPNHPDVRLAIAPGVSVDPEVPWPGELLRVHASVENRGRRPVAAERWRLEAAVRSLRPGSPPILAGIARGVSIDPGGSAAVECSFLAPERGPFELTVALADQAPGPAEGGIADTARVRAMSGGGALLVHEIAFHDRGAGEWIEVLARVDLTDLGAYSLSDETGRAFAVDDGGAPRPARAGQLFVVAERPEMLRSWYAVPESLVLGCRGGWPTLNDSDGDAGLADRVRLLDSEGVLSDAVPYRSECCARGGSLERLDAAFPSASPGSWGESVSPAFGTPAAPNSLRAPAPTDAPARGALLVAVSRSVRRAAGSPVIPAVLRLGEASYGSRIRVRVFDLLGRLRRVLVDGQRVLGGGAFLWDGCDDAGEALAAGVYVVRAETLPEEGAVARASSLALSIVGRGAR